MRCMRTSYKWPTATPPARHASRSLALKRTFRGSVKGRERAEKRCSLPYLVDRKRTGGNPLDPVIEQTSRSRRIAYLGDRLSERLEHHQCIDIAVCGMVEGKWQPPDDLESKLLPEAHRPLVRAHHEVELHAPVSARPGVS